MYPLKGRERPVNALEYQRPTHDELYGRVRELERENAALRLENERLCKKAYLTIKIPRWLAR